MPYCYHDGTPLPVNANFLDTITRLVDVCADLTGIERLVDDGWDAASSVPLVSVLGRALPLSELPETRSSIRFDAGGPGGAQLLVTEATYFWLQLHAAVTLDGDTVFRGPFRVREVGEGVQVRLPGERGWLGTRAAKVRRLDRYFIVGAEASDEVHSLSITKRRGGPALRFVLQAPGFAVPSLVAASGERTPLERGEVDAIRGLWNRVIRGMWNRAHKSPWVLLGGEFEGHSLASLTDASKLAARLLGAIAPLAAEIYYRGGHGDALVVRDERGEPHVLPLIDLSRAVAGLPLSARPAFGPLAGRAATASRLRSVA